jgi:transposase-like protein
MSGHQPTNKTPPETERAIIALVQSGMSMTKAGKAHGVSSNTVRDIFCRNGVELPGKPTSALHSDKLEKLRHLLCKTNKGYAEIAAELGIGKTTARHYAREWGVTHVREVRAPSVRRTSPEREIIVVTMLIERRRVSEIARHVGCAESTVYDIRDRHRDTIEAAREPDAPAPVTPVAKPACHVERWIAEGFDERTARSMARLRKVRGILPVSEYA